jgi:F420-non-reducing hydrogenase iron-sulfur subunit
MSDSYEPIIVGFLCNWCSYRAADLAGMARLHHAPNMRPIRVMCSGRIDPQFVLKALREGADGVLIAGCHPGECHYVEGNIKAMRRFVLLRRMLRQLGVEEERVQLVWAAASEGNVLAAAVNRMTEQLRPLGPLRWRDTVLSETRSVAGNGAGAQRDSEQGNGHLFTPALVNEEAP